MWVDLINMSRLCGQVKRWPGGSWEEENAWEKCQHDIADKYIAARRCLQELGNVLKLDYVNDVLSCVEDIKVSPLYV